MKKEYNFPSNTGVCQIYACAYLPESYDTVLVIHHGMAEHQERYLGFIEYLNNNGIAVYMGMSLPAFLSPDFTASTDLSLNYENVKPQDISAEIATISAWIKVFLSLS